MNERTISYAEALAEAQNLAMERDPSVFLMGVGIDDPGGLFGSTRSTHDRFGDARCFDVPISENALTGAAVGAALVGMRPVLAHARCDFLLLTMDQLANHAAKWSYMSGGLRVPIVVRAVIGRGWGQAAQHSQSLQAVVAHFPGLQVIMPATPYDAKGMLLSALTGDTPVICLEHRWSYGMVGAVPDGIYHVPIGKAAIARPGRDLTLVTMGQMRVEALKAADVLAAQGIEIEVLDLRSIRPWDEAAVLESVGRTGRCIIADTSWWRFGVSAEIAATLSERLFGQLRAPVRRIGLPDAPTPCAPALEAAYYPTPNDLVRMAAELVRGEPVAAAPSEPGSSAKPFRGAF